MKKNNYANPFILERADPYITKGSDGFYYFTASYPAFYNVDNGYDKIILRRSETVCGLSEAEEVTIWKAHESGNMAKHIWAPEIHSICGKWYVFFAAGDSDDVWNIRPYVLKCDGDPLSSEWIECGRMQALPTDKSSFNHFSLDMTYFEHMGKHYVIWAEIIGDSSLFMAEIHPEKPWQLVSNPIMLTKPEYDWEIVKHRVNEGASVLKTDKKLCVFFSASGTGAEYCMGMLTADIDCDIMNIDNWLKNITPILQTEDLSGEVGPGHNSFVKDENGDLLLVYHARPEVHLTGECGTFCEESLYDPCRHARIKYLSINDDGIPEIIL